jgi:hypothetical protein
MTVALSDPAPFETPTDCTRVIAYEAERCQYGPGGNPLESGQSIVNRPQ